LFKEFSISRTSCLGKSPIYQATITSEGHVSWQGEKYVSYIGVKNFTVSKQRVKKIEDLLLSFDYKNFIYNTTAQIVPDSPTCVTRLVYQFGEHKTVVHDLGDEDAACDNSKHTLKKLDSFERKMEELLGLKNLIKQPLYLFHIKSKSNSHEEYVISSSDQADAFQLINVNEANYHNWQIEKLGKDGTGRIHPYMIMSSKM
jgi:hypothetical protein